MIQKVQTLIIGAGVIGSSVAMHLAKQGMTDIRVIDFDLEGSLSSSELNAGGVRATWVQPINIEMSKLTIGFFATLAEEVGYKPCGYLWLHSQNKWEAALKARETQLRLGWPVEVWDVSELKRKVSFIDKTDGIVGALFAPRDGLINPNLLKNYYRTQSRALGVVYDDRTLLCSVEHSEQGSHPIRAVAERFESVMSHETKLDVLTKEVLDSQRSRIEYHAERIINCAGPWAGKVAKIIGYQSPSFPIRRQVSIFDCKEVDLTSYGMIVDTSGVYFHSEATNGLAGYAHPNESHGINYAYDGESFFIETIWPALYERSTHFEKLKHVTGWAGQYEVSPDECAIIGPVHQKEIKRNERIYEAHSFSGHGVMHSYGAGLALAERIIKGRYETLDAAQLAGARFETGQWIRENLVI